MDNRRQGPPSLAAVICVFVVLGAVVASVGTWFIVNQRLAELQQAALARAVWTRARGVQLDFARALHQEWRAARTIAQDIADRDAVSIRASLDLLVGDHSKVSWAGIAGLDGSVIAASGGLLEGRNVASRPWFQRGLEGDFAGDVHEAVLLANMLPSTFGQPRRFLDLASPVKDSQGRATGVLGLYIDFAWAQRFLAETAHMLEIDAFLVDRDGTVLISTNETWSGSTDLPSLRSAAVGAEVAAVELWPDGQFYLTTVVPKVEYEDLPSFGWSLVARINSDAIRKTDRSVSRTLLVSLAGFGLFLAAITFLFIQIFIVPFRRLAASADAIMTRRDAYPYQSNTTSEAAILSTALARFQTRVVNDRRQQDR